MKQFFNESKSGSVSEAIKGLSNPQLIMMFEGNADNFERDVKELEEAFPGVPSVGCLAMGYANSMVDKGIAIIAFCEGVEVQVGMLKEVSKAPVKYIAEMEQKLKALNPGKDDTVCIDFCTGNDACVLTTMSGVLNKYGVGLMGGTGDQGKMACNGVIYEDVDVYCFVKNLKGKVKVYKENIYRPEEGYRFIASETDRSRYYVGKLNGQSAKEVYANLLGISEKDINTQTFKNPLGKMIGKDICIISIKEVSGEGLCCYRQVNDSDVLTLLSLQDYMEVANDTIRKIKNDFNTISCVFSVNCAFRHLLFTGDKAMDDYLKQMGSLNGHCGYVGFGEHYNNQFVNQSMSCVVFE